MLLAIDIGNTNIVLGVFDGDKLIKRFRIWTKGFRTSDEYGIIFLNLFHYGKINIHAFTGAIISCVVPSLLNTIIDALLRYFYIEPLVVTSEIVLGMPILCDKPDEVGADRIANAIGGYEKYKGELIIVDLGTATTFDYITSKGEYGGGVIAPGIMTSLDALYESAAKLPKVEIIKPDRIIGRDTTSCIQSGIFYGAVSMIEGIIERIKKEIKGQPKVIGTGGLVSLLQAESPSIQAVEPDLTLYGLRILYNRNQ